MKKLKNLKILVVEDDPQARDFMKQFLNDEECVVELARDGKEALKRFKTFKPQLVLLDIKLPRMNGIKVLKLIKSQDPDVQVIMTTGISTIESAQECLQAGAYTHLVKPIDFDHLSAIIIQALDIEKEGTGFVPEPKEKNSEPELVESRIDANTDHKVDALIRILLNMGMLTYQDIMEEIKKIKEGSD